MNFSKKTNILIFIGSFVVAALIMLWFNSSYEKVNPAIIGILGLVLLTFPAFIRYFLIIRWKPIEAIVIDSKDLSKVVINNKGGASCTYLYEADIEYSVDGNAFFPTIQKTDGPFLSTVKIYYNPNDPQYCTVKKKMGLSGWGFPILLGFIVWIKYFKNIV